MSSQKMGQGKHSKKKKRNMCYSISNHSKNTFCNNDHQVMGTKEKFKQNNNMKIYFLMESIYKVTNKKLAHAK